jgi:ubiquinone/menaquinone biosynthesis C-methylase UbiE
VLEIAVGSGRNLPFYPAGISLTAVEFSPEMLALARSRAERIGREADLRLGDAERLEFEDESFEWGIVERAIARKPGEREAEV